MDSQPDGKKPEYNLVAKSNCKTCYGRGYIIRTVLIGTGWQSKTAMCFCVKKVPRESGLNPIEEKEERRE